MIDFSKGGSGSCLLMLSGLALMVQAAVIESQFFDFFSPFNDRGV